MPEDNLFDDNNQFQREVRSYQVVGKSLHERIRSGEFHTVGKLPTERDLAEMYGVGRAVIRDALVMLEVKGLVQSRQGSGIYITRAAYEVQSEPVKAADDAEFMSPPKLSEVLAIQQCIDSQIAKLAAVRAGDEAMITLGKILKRIVATEEEAEFCRLVLKLQHLITSSSGNSEFLAARDFIQRRRDSCEGVNSIGLSVMGEHFKSIVCEDYNSILKCIRCRDVDGAYFYTWRHYENQKRVFLKDDGVVRELFEL